MKQILVVDDNRQSADSLVRVLKALGFDARAAYGSSAGLAVLGQETPDAIFLDINMPGVTGFEVLSYLSREPRLSGVPTFVVTSDDQKETRERASKAGARAVLIKPPTVEALEAELRKAKLF